NITLLTPLNGTLQDAIGVDLDFRPGHPRPSSTYFTEDYSLTVTGTVQDPPVPPPNNVPSSTQPVLDARGGHSRGDFQAFNNRGTGHLILPVANTYTGWTRIEQGWVTIRNPNSLGVGYANRSLTYQPGTVVSAGAALHLKPPTNTSLSFPENLTL